MTVTGEAVRGALAGRDGAIVSGCVARGCAGRIGGAPLCDGICAGVCAEACIVMGATANKAHARFITTGNARTLRREPRIVGYFTEKPFICRVVDDGGEWSLVCCTTRGRGNRAPHPRFDLHASPITIFGEHPLSQTRRQSEFTNPNLEPLFTTEQIQARVSELGARIAADYAGRTPLLVGVLKGACIFASDLMRAIDLPLGIEFIAISSYGAQTRSSGEVRIVKDLDVGVEGRDIIVVEDIIDTGLTLSYLLNTLHTRGAASVKLAALLDKYERREREVKIDYLGFQIPDAFVVGYGLDYAERYRNLPYVAALKDPNG